MNIEEYARRHPQLYDDTAVTPLLLRHLSQSPPGTLLEAGCGDGALLYALLRAGALDGWQVRAVDLSAERIAHVRTLDPRIVATVDSVEDLATVPGPIDFAVSTQVIEHVDDDKMIAALARILRPGATLYLATVFKRWYGWYFYRNRGQWVLDPTHVREYRHDEELLGKLRAAGFAILETRKQPCAFPIADLLLKAARVRDRRIFENRLLRLARRVRLPIVGYSIWEIVARR